MTNVTHEHLEFHGTWEQYRHDKANLFRSLGRGSQQKAVKGGAFGVVNADDPSAAYFADCAECRVFTYSVKGRGADLSAANISAFPHGSAYDVTISGGTFRVEDRLPGSFNAGNVLAALLCASGLLKVPVQDLLPFVPLLKPVRGRMTAVRMGQPFEIVVDYAHTPSSFEALFPPLRERLDRTGGRIISLFGSAGERDTRKRPAQGRIAARYSDMIFLCDEDPREEEPMLILEEIASGIEDFEKGKFRRGENLFLVSDRPTAIRKAFAAAKAGDLVLLLGKGHENSIIYSRHTVKYDEIDEAEKAVLELLEKGVKRKPLNP
jgi:UDP-N-acetylmuramoyl-L-alanyl-D-glutamate--2,6-diaminopimelate ligase